MTILNSENIIQEIQKLFAELNSCDQEDLIISLLKNLDGFDPEWRIYSACLNFILLQFIHTKR